MLVTPLHEKKLLSRSINNNNKGVSNEKDSNYWWWHIR